MAQNNKPQKEFRAGGVKAAVWSSDTVHEGRNVTKYSIRIGKRYCDQNGSWKDSDYFFPDDLPKLQLVAAKAFEYTVLKQSEEDFGPMD